MIVVLDTNVVVAGVISPFGASFQLLEMMPQRRFDALLSVPLMLEYEDVLKRDNIRAQHRLSLQEIDTLLNTIAACGTAQAIFFLWRPHLQDPKDDMVLEVAVNGRAEAIVTLNERDFRPQAARFGLDILRPGAFLRRLHQS